MSNKAVSKRSKCEVCGKYLSDHTNYEKRGCEVKNSQTYKDLMSELNTTMTEKEILQKAIEKAISNGYAPIKYLHGEIADNQVSHITSLYEVGDMSLEEILFDHNFAKAFFGNKEIERLDYINLDEPNEERVMVKILLWQYHLQQMVLKENPILYLEQFLDILS